MKRVFEKRDFTAGYIPGRKPLSAEAYDYKYYSGQRRKYGFNLYRERNYLDPEKSRGKFIDILKLLTRYSRGELILDVGCGAGHLVHWSNKLKLPFKISSCDISAEAQHIQATKIEGFKTCYAEKLDFADSSFDAVTIIDVIEHLYPKNAIKAFREAFRVLKPGGIIVIKTPNRITWDRRTYQDQSHVWLGTTQEINRVLALVDFKIVKSFTRGFWWSSIWERLFGCDFRFPLGGNAIYSIASKT